MKLKFILLTALIIANSLFALQAQTVAEEPPTSNGIYQISTLAHLRWISENSTSWESDFEQTANIDASETSTWNVGDHDEDAATPDEPMGIIPFGTIANKFRGTYNGNDFSISGLYINRPEVYYVGLFGLIYNSDIYDISLIDANVTGDNWVGALVGYSWGSTITNASSSGVVSGAWNVGGLVGLTIQYSEISYSHSSCSVSARGGDAGGFIGANTYSDIEYSYSTGSVSSSSQLGGFAGRHEAAHSMIKNCYSTGSVSGRMLMGGFVGRTTSSTTENCFCSGSIEVLGTYNTVGGFVGLNNSFGYIQDCYTLSAMTTIWDINYGGFAGDNKNSIQNCFWNTDIEPTDNGLATGLTTAEMKQLCTFVDGTNASWDFMEETTNGSDDNWGMNASENDGYPFLAIQGYDQTEECCGFVDLTDPVLSAEHITLYLDASGSAAFTPADVVAYSLDNCAVSDSTLSQSVFSCTETGENMVDVTLIDEGGNTAVQQITVTVIDDIDPELTVKDINLYLDGTGNASLSASDVVTSATDNCSVVDTVLSQSIFDCSETGAFLIDVTITDASGNMDTKQATITILDTISPALTVQNVTVYLGENGSASITPSQVVTSATDNCTIADTTLSQSEFDCSETGQVLVDVTLTDASGNTDVEQITVTVLDEISPELAVQDITVYLDETGTATLTPAQVVTSATDNCTISDTTLSQSSFDCSETGEILVDVTLTDASGNTDVKQITVTVLDEISPELTVQDITVYLNEAGSASITLAQVVTSATDNCSIADTTLSQSEFDCFEVGEVFIDVTLTDASGNTDVEQVTVTVLDEISPELSIQDITVYLDETGSATIIPSQVVTSATDNCTIGDTTLSQSIFDCDDVWAPVNVDVTLIDASGNEVTEQVTITVEDNVAPVLSVQNYTLALDESGTANLYLSDIVVDASDNCTVADTILSQSVFDCDDVWAPVNIDVTLIDAAGNEVTEQVVITVEDNVAPILSVQNITINLDESGSAIITPLQVVTNATDNCTIADTTLSQSQFDCSETGEFLVDVTLTDASGNTDVEQITVTVLDEVAPELSVQDITVYLEETGSVTLLPSQVVTNASDNCTLADTILSQSLFDCDDLWAPVNIDVTLIDASGNEVTAQVVITVEDNVAPELDVQDFTIQLDETGMATLFPSDVVVNATDNCSIVDTLLSQTEFTANDIGVQSIDVTVTDASDNQAIEQVNITVLEYVGIQNGYLNQTVKIYPNPATDHIQISCEDFIAKNITIVDYSGRVILIQNVNQNIVELNITNLSPGLYFVKIKSDDKYKTLKLIKR